MDWRVVNYVFASFLRHSQRINVGYGMCSHLKRLLHHGKIIETDFELEQKKTTGRIECVVSKAMANEQEQVT